MVLFQSIFCLLVGVVGLSSFSHRRVSWLSNITKNTKSNTDTTVPHSHTTRRLQPHYNSKRQHLYPVNEGVRRQVPPLISPRDVNPFGWMGWICIRFEG